MEVQVLDREGDEIHLTRFVCESCLRGGSEELAAQLRRQAEHHRRVENAETRIRALER
jgi:hypothetical protein